MTPPRSSRFGFGAALLLAGLKGTSLFTEAAPAALPTLCTLLVIVAALRVSGRAGTRRWVRRGVIVLALSMASFIAMTIWVNHRLAQAYESFQPVAGPKIWSTRGLVLSGADILQDGEQNSIEAIARAFDEGAAGVEVDVFYDAELADFVVSHDRPYNKKNGALLMLDQLLAAVGERGAIWLDWKKLRHLDRTQMEAALASLDRYTSQGGLKGRFFIEGEDPFNLTRCGRAGFPTIYDSHPLPDANPFSSLVIDFYKAIYHFGGFTVLSMETGSAERMILGPGTVAALDRVPIFAYHAPADSTLLGPLHAQENVQVILLRDQSRNAFRWSGSSGTPLPR